MNENDLFSTPEGCNHEDDAMTEALQSMDTKISVQNAPLGIFSTNRLS